MEDVNIFPLLALAEKQWGKYLTVFSAAHRHITPCAVCQGSGACKFNIQHCLCTSGTRDPKGSGIFAPPVSEVNICTLAYTRVRTGVVLNGMNRGDEIRADVIGIHAKERYELAPTDVLDFSEHPTCVHIQYCE